MENTEDKNCPASEILEDYRDGVAADEWVRHIDGCPRCQRRIAALDLLDLRVRSVCAPPDGMAERIKAAVREGRGPSIHGMPFWRRGWFRGTASAAVLMVLLSLSIYIVSYNETDNADSSRIAAVPSDGGEGIGVEPSAALKSVNPTVAAMNSVDDAMEEAVPAPMAAPSAKMADAGKMLNSRSAKAKGLSDSPLRLAGPRGESPDLQHERKMPLQSLDGAVRHIWLVENAEDAREFIGRIAAANEKSVEINRNDGGFTAVIELKDAQLQQLVDLLNERGWKLMSPYLPQPGKAESLFLKGEPVRYYINIIEDGK
ncbi:MAG: hypothetical protein J5833_03135 [Victivallales bacterium]|nr:hypothetical protein [Victivallales bacterium]